MTAIPEIPAAAPAPAKRAGVVQRVTQIVDALGEAPGRLLLEDVTQITGMPRSTVFRILRQLAELGWVDDTELGYSIGPRLRPDASTNEHEAIRSAASSALNQLASATGAVAHLAVLRSGFVVYLDKIGAGAAPTVPSQVGARILATEAAAGLAILASMSPEDVDSVLGQTGIASERWDESLHRDLFRIRQHHGIAQWAGANRNSGISSIAAPIMGPKGPVGALSVARRGALPMSSVAPLVTEAARVTSRRLFPKWEPVPRRCPPHV